MAPETREALLRPAALASFSSRRLVAGSMLTMNFVVATVLIVIVYHMADFAL